MQIRIKFAADGEVFEESSGGDRDIEPAKMKVEGVSLLEFSDLEGCALVFIQA